MSCTGTDQVTLHDYPVLGENGVGDTHSYLASIHSALVDVHATNATKLMLGYIPVIGDFSLAIAVAINALSVGKICMFLLLRAHFSEMLLLAPAGDEHHLACMTVPAYSTRVLTIGAASPIHYLPHLKSNYGDCINMYSSGEPLCRGSTCTYDSIAASFRVLRKAHSLSTDVMHNISHYSSNTSTITRTILVDRMRDELIHAEYAVSWQDGMYRPHQMPCLCSVGLHNNSVLVDKILVGILPPKNEVSRISSS